MKNVIEAVIMTTMSTGNHVPGLFKGDNSKITFMNDSEDMAKSFMHFGTKPVHMHLGAKLPLSPDCVVACSCQGGWRIGTYKFDPDNNTYDVVENDIAYPFSTPEYIYRIVASTDRELCFTDSIADISKLYLKHYSLLPTKPERVDIDIIETFISLKLVKILLTDGAGCIILNYQ